MKYKVGDRVAFSFKQHALDTGSFIQFTSDVILKDSIEKIKTHDLLFFKKKISNV